MIVYIRKDRLFRDDGQFKGIATMTQRRTIEIGGVSFTVMGDPGLANTKVDDIIELGSQYLKYLASRHGMLH